DHVSDRWQWRTDLEDGYTVRGAYQFLTTQEAVTLDAASGLIWHRQVPLKVSICAWRLLRDRLPTKANLLFWLSLVTGQLLDWFFFGDCSDSFRTLGSVYGFSWWF
ncbi:cysteine-rich receptor-like protein kinase, partial [Trifolium pratense]